MTANIQTLKLLFMYRCLFDLKHFFCVDDFNPKIRANTPLFSYFVFTFIMHHYKIPGKEEIESRKILTLRWYNLLRKEGPRVKASLVFIAEWKCLLCARTFSSQTLLHEEYKFSWTGSGTMGRYLFKKHFLFSRCVYDRSNRQFIFKFSETLQR